MEQNQGDVNDIESEGMVYEENELQRNGSSFSEKSLSSGMIREPLLVKSMRTNTTSQIAIVGANVREHSNTMVFQCCGSKTVFSFIDAVL
ncbi:hypothetical protein LOK49_LG09G01324 [Camellia lanceoleosa]|uniref:Uncharacterized protein n=1 Tax=Camellia lanceoleosa TaxID=1840588 RepID=A0ACC0GF27_9ERIC|nr:hypothetical protein LOK49_LG09G01324 [Camellia lanceoleosa]